MTRLVILVTLPLFLAEVPIVRAQGEGMLLADLHFHAQQRLSPEEALRAMDRAGV